MGEVAATEPPNYGGGDEKKVEKAEEEERLMENMVVLDFDMLCTTVAMQTHMGKWSKLNGDNENDEESSILYPNGGVFRMWEGELLYDCFDDRLIALQSSCFPCYRFGKNMRKAGYGSCFVQGSVYLILMLLAVMSMLAFVITERPSFCLSNRWLHAFDRAYLGFYRSLMRKKFNIRDDNSSLDDCVYHLLCPCCSLGQESRTLEMNNVQDGIWHGRGDTVCIGNSSSAIYTPMPQFMSITDPVGPAKHFESCKW